MASGNEKAAGIRTPAVLPKSSNLSAFSRRNGFLCDQYVLFDFIIYVRKLQFNSGYLQKDF